MIEGIRRLRKYVHEHTHENVSGPSNDFDNSARPLDVLTIADAIEREVEERYILLPVDRNNAPIHIGDRVYTTLGGTFEVARITREDYNGTTTWYIEDFASRYSLGPEDLVHHKPPTVEDVLNELCLEYVKSWNGESSKSERREIVAEYAANLQLKETE